jgi:tetratricopeptide (TPR) repeat protein
MEKIEEEIDSNKSDILLKFEKGFLLQFMPKFYNSNNNIESGISFLDETRREFSENEKIWELVLLSLLNENRFADGIKIISIMKGKSLNTTNCNELLLKYSIDTNNESSKEYFKELIKTSPKNILINDYFKYKTIELKKSDDSVKIAEYIRKCRKNSTDNDPISLFKLAYAYNTLYDTAKIFGEPFSLSMAIFKQLLSIDENFIAVYGGIKETAIRASHEFPELLDDAERHLVKAIESFPNNSFIYRQYGELLDKGFGKNRKREAMEYYEKSLNLDFYSPQVHQSIAGISRLLNDIRKSTYHYMVVTELSWDEKIKEDSVRALNYLRRSKTI